MIYCAKNNTESKRRLGNEHYLGNRYHLDIVRRCRIVWIAENTYKIQSKNMDETLHSLSGYRMDTPWNSLDCTCFGNHGQRAGIFHYVASPTCLYRSRIHLCYSPGSKVYRQNKTGKIISSDKRKTATVYRGINLFSIWPIYCCDIIEKHTENSVLFIFSCLYKSFYS